jgi:hypothetical protein
MKNALVFAKKGNHRNGTLINRNQSAECNQNTQPDKPIVNKKAHKYIFYKVTTKDEGHSRIG